MRFLNNGMLASALYGSLMSGSGWSIRIYSPILVIVQILTNVLHLFLRSAATVPYWTTLPKTRGLTGFSLYVPFVWLQLHPYTFP